MLLGSCGKTTLLTFRNVTLLADILFVDSQLKQRAIAKTCDVSTLKRTVWTSTH